MASIRKRNGKYEVQVRRKGFAPVCRNFHRKSDAEEWARFSETRADRGELLASSKVLDRCKVRDVIERYRDEISVKKKSHDTEIFILNAFLRQPMADYTIARITSTDFSSYREKRLLVVKPGTVNRELSIIKHAFDIAMKEWDIPIRKNPLDKLQKLKVNNARSRRVSKEEMEALHNAIRKTRNNYMMPLIRFAIETGMRRGEMLQAIWKEVNFENKTLFIPVTKNGHSRTIPLTSEAISILQELKKENGEGTCIFPLTACAVRNSWDRLILRAKIQDLHFHDFRHEAISRFFEKGLSIPEVALISGHRDFKMLYRYTNLRPEDVAKKLQ